MNGIQPSGRLLLKTRPIQLVIHPLIRQKLRMRSLLDDRAIVDDHDLTHTGRHYIGSIDTRRLLRGTYQMR